MTEPNEYWATDSYHEVSKTFPVGEPIDFSAVDRACDEFLDEPEAIEIKPELESYDD